MVCMAWTGRGWPGSKLAKPGKEKEEAYNWPALAAAGGAKNWSSLPRNAWPRSNYRTCILSQGLP